LQWQTDQRRFAFSVAGHKSNYKNNFFSSIPTIKIDNDRLFCVKNHSTLMVMCVYEKASSGMASSKDTENSKLAEDIKDAVNLLTNLKSKGYDIGKRL
jgi:hypothetical protein